MQNPFGLFSDTSILRALRAFLVFAAGFGLPAVLATAAGRSEHYTPYHGETAPDSVVAGTMPEDYLPGLMEIVHSALKHGPTMIVQQIEVAQSEAALLNADSILYPQISASGSYGLSSESVGEAGQFGAAGSHSTGNSTSESYGISASMPIFRWGAVWNGIRIQKLSLEITRKSYAEAYRSFVVQLRDSYMALVAKKIGVRNARRNVEITNQNFAQARENLQNGTIAEGATVAPRLAAEDASLAYDKLVADYSHSKRILAQLAGVPDIADDSIPEGLPKINYASGVANDVLAAFLRDGARSTFQAENLEMAVHQDQLNYLIALTRPLPQFSGYYSYTAADTTSVAFSAPAPGQAAAPSAIAKVGEVVTSYGISAGWDIFDGFSTTANIRSAKAAKRLGDRQLQTYLDVALEQAQDARRQLDLSARAMRLAEERYALAEAALRQTTADFKFGTATQAMVDNVKFALEVGEQAQLSARADFLSRWSAFVSLTDADPALGLLPIQYVRSIR